MSQPGQTVFARRDKLPPVVLGDRQLVLEAERLVLAPSPRDLPAYLRVFGAQLDAQVGGDLPRCLLVLSRVKGCCRAGPLN